jgi:hypothetical protein
MKILLTLGFRTPTRPRGMPSRTRDGGGVDDTTIGRWRKSSRRQMSPDQILESVARLLKRREVALRRTGGRIVQQRLLRLRTARKNISSTAIDRRSIPPPVGADHSCPWVARHSCPGAGDVLIPPSGLGKYQHSNLGLRVSFVIRLSKFEFPYKDALAVFEAPDDPAAVPSTELRIAVT